MSRLSMDTKKIEKLINILESSSLQEMQIEEDGVSVYLNKGATGEVVVAQPAPQVAAPIAASEPIAVDEAPAANVSGNQI